MFRLWLVASVIWVAIIGGIAYREWRAVPQPMKVYVLPNAASDFHLLDNVFSQFDPNVQSAHLTIQYPHGITLLIHNSVATDAAEGKKREFERDFVEPLARSYDQTRYDTLTGYLETALFPPIALLALGAAMAWALTGFRRD